MNHLKQYHHHSCFNPYISTQEPSNKYRLQISTTLTILYKNVDFLLNQHHQGMLIVWNHLTLSSFLNLFLSAITLAKSSRRHPVSTQS